MANQQTSAPATNDLPGDKMLESAVEDICRFAVKLKLGKQNDEQIQKRLTEAGLSIEDAKTVTRVGLARMGKDRSAGRKNLLLGVLWLAGGGIAALVTSSAASSAARNVVVYGALLLGIFQMIFGWIQVLRAPRGKGEIQDIVERITPTIDARETSRWKIAAVKIHNP